MNNQDWEIKLEHISKNFDEKCILNDLNYTFCSNNCYVLQGESGIGKTTLINIIGGYLEADNGTISIPNNIKMDYMFQEEMLFSNLTVAENLAIKYYADATKEKWDTEFIRKEYGKVLDQFGIDGLLGQKVSSLSGGEKQRVLLASMIISNAQILLLDEPVTKLDQENREQILRMIDECVHGRILIIVSHIELDIKKNLKILKLENGKLYEKERNS